jgi:hypothetical protein
MAKARCTNCGSQLKQKAAKGWNLYCKKEGCRQAALKALLEPNAEKRE